MMSKVQLHEKSILLLLQKNPTMTLIGGEVQSWQGPDTVCIAGWSLISMWLREIMPCPPFSFDVKYTLDDEIF